MFPRYYGSLAVWRVPKAGGRVPLSPALGATILWAVTRDILGIHLSPRSPTCRHVTVPWGHHLYLGSCRPAQRALRRCLGARARTEVMGQCVGDQLALILACLSAR